LTAPQPEKLLECISEAAERLAQEASQGTPFVRGLVRGRRYGNVILAGGIRGEYAIIGDIHGDVETLDAILSRIDGADIIIFLGDYVDRGRPEGQVEALCRVLTLYLEGRALPLRGNHEPPRGLVPSPHDFPDALIKLYGMSTAARIYEKAARLFDLLPHALVVEGSFLAVHGGPPTRGFEKPLVEYLAGGTPDPSLEILEEILWNDPVEADAIRLPSIRGAGFMWGRPTTSRALEKARAKIIVRGHEATYGGYKWNHEGRVLTLFSVRAPPYYSEAAGYLYTEGCEPGPGRDECVRLVY